MNNPRCDVCGGATKRNGLSKSGKQRWRCKECGASFVRTIDNAAKLLGLFLRRLLSKSTQSEMGYSRSKFKRLTAGFWRIWPIASYTGEVCDVVFLDGIWIARRVVVLIASTRGRVLAWHLAQSECAEAWGALMLRIPAPVMAVSDGAPGLAKAARAIWPGTRVQRCLFHVFESVKRCTTARPKLDCGRELYLLARKLLKARDADAAAAWLAEYAGWCSKWERFLREFTLKDGRRQYTHERLRKARRILNRLARDGTMFTFAELQEEPGGTWESTNNAIEGGVNAQLRRMLRSHSGMTTIHRVKAVFWWCLMHSECALAPAEILRVMPTDDDVAGLYASGSGDGRRDDGSPEEHGSGIVWSEFHMPTEYRS